MKGVFPSLGPKALVGTKQDTRSVSFSSLLLFFVLFFEDGAVPGVARCAGVMIQKYWFFVALFFSTAHPAFSAQRSERVKHGNSPTFLGDFQIIFLLLKTQRKGTPRWKVQIVRQMQQICFELSKIKWMIHQFSPHILNRMVVMLNLFLCFPFYLFLTLNSGGLVCCTLLSIST